MIELLLIAILITLLGWWSIVLWLTGAVIACVIIGKFILGFINFWDK